ncbi:YqaJ viral recombinase family protein [Nonomuraea polychroma]|uniref:YqaJ viral recombinase family nuclease n=1 Tax=Nonomuraea polychroma TaxID=46176 RepID=UPI003D9062E2
MTATAALGRRVTPTARLVLPATADRDMWLAARRNGIGSSDVPDCLEVGYKTPSHVYYGKLGELPPEDLGEPGLWGTLHEETIAREWARRNRSVVRRVGLIAHIDQPWMMCTLDRQVAECPLSRDVRERCALEVKHRDAWVAKRWKRAVPDDVLAQTLWQIAVSGYDHIHTAVLIGGNNYRQHVVRRAGNEQLISDIVTVAGQMWQRIQDRTPPPTTGEPERLLDLWDRLYPDRDGVADLDQTDAHEHLLGYEDARLRAAAAEKEKKAEKARLIEALGPHRMGAFGNDYAYGLQEVGIAPDVDLELLAEKYPQAYAECVTERTTLKIHIDKQHRLTEPLS